MSSKINNQPVDIEKIILPVCVNTTSAPSLTPTTGSLVQDAAAGGLYIGNGASFTQIDSTATNSAFFQSGITMNSGASNPAFTGVNFYVNQIIDDGTGNSINSFVCVINSTSAAANCPDTWTSTTAFIPSKYRPQVTSTFPVWITGNSSPQVFGYFSVLSTGSVSLSVVTTNANTNVTVATASGNYYAP